MHRTTENDYKTELWSICSHSFLLMKACAFRIILGPTIHLVVQNPSGSGYALTDGGLLASHLFNMRVCDHLIVTPGSFYSFSDVGLIRFGMVLIP